jgi:hypothetical protein
MAKPFVSLARKLVMLMMDGLLVSTTFCMYPFIRLGRQGLAQLSLDAWSICFTLQQNILSKL